MARYLRASSVLAALALAACAAPTSEDPADDASESQDELRRYVDAPRERPEVGIVRMPGSYCTGTLIGPRTVLTAAHCFHFGSAVVADSAAPAGKFQIDRADGTRLSFPFHRYRADATVLEVHFDLAVVQLDAPVPADIATPATVAASWPDEGRLTVFGYGSYGDGCRNKDSVLAKRKTTVPRDFPFVKATTCPGDSGGPYFQGETRSIVATVKGDGLGLEWVGDAVRHRAWILARAAESERGALSLE